MCCLLNQPKFGIGRTYQIGAFGRWSICGKQTIASFRNMVQRSNTITKTPLVAKMLAWGPLHWQGQMGCRQGVWMLRKLGFPSRVGGVGPWHPKPGTKLWSANGVLAEEYTVRGRAREGGRGLDRGREGSNGRGRAREGGLRLERERDGLRERGEG